MNIINKTLCTQINSSNIDLNILFFIIFNKFFNNITGFSVRIPRLNIKKISNITYKVQKELNEKYKY